MLFNIFMYLMIGVAIFSIRYALLPKWRKILSNPNKPEEDITSLIMFTIGYALAWPFISLALYFWKDSDETGETSNDPE